MWCQALVWDVVSEVLRPDVAGLVVDLSWYRGQRHLPVGPGHDDRDSTVVGAGAGCPRVALVAEPTSRDGYRGIRKACGTGGGSVKEAHLDGLDRPLSLLELPAVPGPVEPPTGASSGDVDPHRARIRRSPEEATAPTASGLPIPDGLQLGASIPSNPARREKQRRC